MVEVGPQFEKRRQCPRPTRSDTSHHRTIQFLALINIRLRDDSPCASDEPWRHLSSRPNEKRIPRLICFLRGAPP
jgi:hypothetical protein